jgi:hypothetical protein
VAEQLALFEPETDVVERAEQQNPTSGAKPQQPPEPSSPSRKPRLLFLSLDDPRRPRNRVRAATA